MYSLLKRDDWFYYLLAWDGKRKAGPVFQVRFLPNRERYRSPVQIEPSNLTQRSCHVPWSCKERLRLNTVLSNISLVEIYFLRFCLYLDLGRSWITEVELNCQLKRRREEIRTIFSAHIDAFWLITLGQKNPTLHHIAFKKYLHMNTRCVWDE